MIGILTKLGIPTSDADQPMEIRNTLSVLLDDGRRGKQVSCARGRAGTMAC